jgi:hypothetical protein
MYTRPYHTNQFERQALEEMQYQPQGNTVPYPDRHHKKQRQYFPLQPQTAQANKY